VENFIILAILFSVVGAAVFYIFKEKKKGKKCIGCPYSEQNHVIVMMEKNAVVMMEKNAVSLPKSKTECIIL